MTCVSRQLGTSFSKEGKWQKGNAGDAAQEDGHYFAPRFQTIAEQVTQRGQSCNENG